MSATKQTSILLSTYNGDKYLKQQLDSLSNQTYKDIEIIGRDDCSIDHNLDVLKSYDVEMVSASENLGPKGSFLTLLEYSLKSDSQYFMFCDQDDVWEKDKIEKTLAKMKELENEFGDIPLLVHTDLEVVDEELNTIDNSFWHFEQINPSMNDFNRLLMQNTITGCTMMINKKLAKFVLPVPNDAIMHDWWIGLVASKFGKIGIVDEKTIKYRQHINNNIGAKVFGVKYILNRLLNKNTLSKNIKQAKAFLSIYKEKLDRDSIKMLEDFICMEEKSFYQKRKILFKYKLIKQGFMRNLGLFLKI
jgi:glycosyltransferase involved in cell wall biosynthesis